jgi:plastocyanin
MIVLAASALGSASFTEAASSATTPTIVTVTTGKPSISHFTLSRHSVPLGAVKFDVSNRGVSPNSFEVCSSRNGGRADACAGAVTQTIKPGGHASLTVTFTTAGTYEYLSTLPGHAAAGMKGDLSVVRGATSVSPKPSGAAAAAPTINAAQAQVLAVINQNPSVSVGQENVSCTRLTTTFFKCTWVSVFQTAIDWTGDATVTYYKYGADVVISASACQDDTATQVLCATEPGPANG